MPGLDIQFAVDDDGLPRRATIERWVAAAFAGVGSPPGPLSIRVVDEPEARELNARFRGRNAATNVLSFPTDADGWPPGEPRSFGDVVVCAPLLARQADEAGRPVEEHWCHIVVHGVLHLLGYDHQNDSDALEMEQTEREVLATLGFPDPYR